MPEYLAERSIGTSDMFMLRYSFHPFSAVAVDGLGAGDENHPVLAMWLPMLQLAYVTLS